MQINQDNDEAAMSGTFNSHVSKEIFSKAVFS